MVPTPFAGADAYPDTLPRPVVTIGNFDGVHRGHRVLLERTIARARALDTNALVYTFHPAPRDVLRPDNDIPRIQALEDRVATLHAVGIDHVVVEPFTLALAGREPEWFAREILARRLRAQALVLGWDFRFGARRAGTTADLREWLSVPVEQVEAVRAAGDIASSSRIRQLVRSGDVATAATLLTRPHRVRGTVVHGDARGRGLGFPTANLALDTPLQPAPGVYAVLTDLGQGAPRPGVANFGRRPTFGGGAEVLEVHLFDYDGDLYGQALAVDFVARIRGERTFDGIEALKAQIDSDIQAARDVLA